jgi:N-acyl-D-aspartate/D-glutamate deacylase
LDITADVYPYVAASAGLVDLLPPWAREGGLEKVMERLRDSAVRERIKNELAVDTSEWENEYYGAGGAKGFVISSVLNEKLKSLEGRRLSDIAGERRRDPRDVIMDIILEDQSSPLFISFIMDESDVRLALKQEWSCFCTDSEIAATDGPLSGSHLHPRAYGSMARILGRYVREEGLMSLEQAIRKASSLPAQVLGIRDRGLLRGGFYADLVIYDPKTVIDKASFEQPNQYSSGIDYVLVNGEVVVEKGKVTGARPGKVLRGPGFKRSAGSKS